MHHGMKNQCELKLGCYSDCLIDINGYLDALPGAKASDKIFETELNEILFNGMSNIWSRQVYVRGFNCESIPLKICEHILTH